MNKLGILLAAGTALAASPAWATTVVEGGTTFDETGALTLTLGNFVPPGNQPTQIPCLICGENQPQQPATFGYTNFGNTGNNHDIKFFAADIIGGGNPGANTIPIATQRYTDTFLRNFLINVIGDKNLSFTIGVDVNDSGPMHPQTLSQFLMLDLTTDKVLAFLPNPVVVPSVNNGTGHADYTISGFDDVLDHVAAGDQITFFSEISNANDGPDQFFLEAGRTAAPVPIPGALGLFGSGLIGLGILARRRARRYDLHTV